MKQLYTQTGPVSAITAYQQYGLTLMDYNSVIAAIPQTWKRELKLHEIKNTEEDIYYQTMTKRSNLSTYVYSVLIEKLSLIDLKQKWQSELQARYTVEELKNCFRNVYVITNSPKLRSFQYRLIHRAVITNLHLFKGGKRQTNLCSFCELLPAIYGHLFRQCNFVAELCNALDKFMQDFTKEVTNMDVQNIIFNSIVKSPKSIKNTITLMLKQYIYRTRCLHKTLSFEEFKSYVWTTKNIERYIAIKNDKCEVLQLCNGCSAWRALGMAKTVTRVP